MTKGLNSIPSPIKTDGRMFRAKMELLGANERQLAIACECSINIIYILKGGGVTHPIIADRIARVMGLTGEERNAIVPAIHEEALTEEQKRIRWGELPFSKRQARKRREETKKESYYD